MSGADEERPGAVAASDVQTSEPPTEIVPGVTEAEPPTAIAPVAQPATGVGEPDWRAGEPAPAEPVPAVEPVDKRPTFEASPATASDAPLGAAPSSPTDERPELLVGAAFTGGLVAALILKRLGR